MDIFIIYNIFSLLVTVFSLGAARNNGMFTECCIHNYNNYYYMYIECRYITRINMRVIIPL